MSIWPGVPGLVALASQRALFSIVMAESAVTFTLKVTTCGVPDWMSASTHSAYPRPSETVTPPLLALLATISVPSGA